MKSPLKFGVIGSGFMGKAYAVALHSAPAIFDLPAKTVAEMIATTNHQSAATQGEKLGFNRSTGNWLELVSDPQIDVVGICTPTWTHKEMALAAIAFGKHVLCEKPLALSAKDAYEMAEAAESAAVKTLVGFNYMKSPACQLAKQMMDSGELGEIIHFRGAHNEDYLMNPSSAGGWRLKEEFAGKAGALGDLASHIVNMAHFLCGPILEVVGESQIIHKFRPNSGGVMVPVENDDQTTFLAKFECGVMGAFEASRVAAGKKNGLSFEVIGTQGSIVFDQERLGELQYYSSKDQVTRQGFRTILIGPEHPDYGNFCVGGGHGMGYNDMIAIEIKDLVEGIVNDKAIWPSFRDAAHTACVVEAVLQSQVERKWIKVCQLAT